MDLIKNNTEYIKCINKLNELTYEEIEIMDKIVK